MCPEAMELGSYTPSIRWLYIVPCFLGSVGGRNPEDAVSIGQGQCLGDRQGLYVGGDVWNSPPSITHSVFPQVGSVLKQTPAPVTKKVPAL